MSQESILKEISVALEQRKKLNCQVNKLTSEVNALERLSIVNLPPLPRLTFPTTNSIQRTFSSPTPPPNGLTTPAVGHVQQTQPSGRPPPTLQPQPRKPGSAGSTRRSQEWPDIPDIGKIEEKNPEILAKKILETGRQIETGKYGTELTPRVQSVNEKRVLQSEKIRNPNRNSRTSQINKSSMAQAQPQVSTNTPSPQPSQPVGGKSLTISPADSTPRVNDFEDRLKNLITSVLNDNSKPTSMNPHSFDGAASCSPLKQFTVPMKTMEPEREGLMARAPPKSVFSIQHQQQQPDYTQFSPAKLALRRHLSQAHVPYSQPLKLPSEFNYGDLVTGEIVRSLESPSSNQLGVSTQPSSVTRQTYSPISRPGSTDCHAISTTSLSSNTDVHLVSGLPSVATPSTEHVEGLAASLRDCLRPSTEATPEPVASTTTTVPTSVENVAENSPPKRKRSSVDSASEVPKEKKHGTGETHPREWQDKITSRFDKLMTFASTEMDKRRQSTESCSPRT